MERWTLGEIHSRAPPIPVRRNAGGNNNNCLPMLSQASSSIQQQAAVAVAQAKGLTESRSAPSSPTEKEEQESGDRMGVERHQRSPTVHHSPRRPRSMAVEEGARVQYTTISFPDAESSRTPPTRRNTNYADIKHQPVRSKHQEKGAAAPPGGPDSREAGSDSPVAYINVGGGGGGGGGRGVNKHGEEVNDVTYDVPPPPVPVRFSSQDSAHEQTPSTTTTAPAAAATAAPTGSSRPNPHPSEDPHPEDPFAQSKFGDPFMDSCWDNPTAFYDRPRNTMATTSGNSCALEDGYMEIGKSPTGITTADFTGDSSYEDTSAFLQDMRDRYKNRPTEESKMPVAPREDNDGPGATYDIPPIDHSHSHEGKNIPLTHIDDDAQLGSYDFPTALNVYPFKEGGGDGGVASREEPARRKEEPARRKEEPPMHTIQYPIQQKTSHPPSSTSVGPPAPAARSESYPLGPRSNVPLPPTPMDERNPEPSGREDPPPLPARQGGTGGNKQFSSARDNPLPPIPGAGAAAGDRPRLPPFNHPWGNKKPHSQPSQDSHNPPLPPRKKAQANPNGHSQGVSGEGASGAGPHEDPTMLDLISKGYQRADIESALRIAKNDYELAKSILKEFGGRH